MQMSAEVLFVHRPAANIPDDTAVSDRLPNMFISQFLHPGVKGTKVTVVDLHPASVIRIFTQCRYATVCNGIYRIAFICLKIERIVDSPYACMAVLFHAVFGESAKKP